MSGKLCSHVMKEHLNLWLCTYFGPTNSLSTLQIMMNALFFDMGACVMVYMDDIYTKTKEGHDEIVLQILEILWKNDLFVKAEKC